MTTSTHRALPQPLLVTVASALTDILRPALRRLDALVSSVQSPYVLLVDRRDG